MCVAVPGKVVKINGNYAKVNVMDNTTDVNVKLVDVKIGDYVLIHAGCAIEVLSQEAAQEIIDVFSELLEEVYDDSRPGDQGTERL